MSTNTLIAVIVVAALVTVVLDRFVLLRFTRPGGNHPEFPPAEKKTEEVEWPHHDQ